MILLLHIPEKKFDSKSDKVELLNLIWNGLNTWIDQDNANGGWFRFWWLNLCEVRVVHVLRSNTDNNRQGRENWMGISIHSLKHAERKSESDNDSS